MEEENKKTPKFLYLFCHYLMLASLGLFLLLFVAVMIYGLTPVSWYSYEFVCWVVRFTNWACPILIGIFAASSKFAVRCYADNYVDREWTAEDWQKFWKEYYKDKRRAPEPEKYDPDKAKREEEEKWARWARGDWGDGKPESK